MSTRDMKLEMGEGYKKSQGNYIGHHMPMMAEHSGLDTRIYDNIMPNCGPLLFINNNRQRWTTGCTISFSYEIAEETGFTSETIEGISYNKKFYTGVAGTYNGTVTFTSGMRDYSQILYNTHPHIRNILSLSLSDETQDIGVYCLADDGTRLLYGMHDELMRDMEDIISRAYFVSPPLCQLCKGVGEYPTGTICPDCDGYKYVGRNAEQWMLIERAKDVKVKKRTETENSLQYRAWASKWHVIPTKDRIREYVAHFLRLGTGFVTVEERYWPEAYFTVRFPLYTYDNDEGVGNILSLSGTSLEDLMQDAAPAGTNAIFESYYLFTDLSTVHDYCHDFSERPHDTPVTPTFGFIFPIISDGWNNGSFGSEFGTSFFYDTGLFLEYSGILNDDGGTGVWSGAVEIADTGFWTGYSAAEHERIITYDLPFTGSTGVY